MFASLLEKENEKLLFAKLCFIVALADPSGERSDVTTDFMQRILANDTFSFNAFRGLGLATAAAASVAFQSGTTATVDCLNNNQNTSGEYREFFKKYYINLQEALLLQEIITRLDLDLDELKKVIVKANEFFKNGKEDYKTLFSALIPQIIDSNISTQSKKIILFEMCNMAFKDGDCSDAEKIVILLAGEYFKLDSETIEEIVQEAENFNKIYNTCIEIIFE